MTFRVVVLLIAALLPVGCAVQPLPDSARMLPPTAFGGFADAGVSAINLSSWAFADPMRTRGDPGDAARAAAAVDYLAGQLFADPRWQGVDPLYKQQMLDARAEVRRALGINAAARSQQVVDTLLAAANAMAAPDTAALNVALRSPVFTMTPQETYARLVNMPYLPTTNVATLHIENGIDGPEGGRGCTRCG